nr:GNAT family N-acetyltransferase [uncultured Bacteroides sp.]
MKLETERLELIPLLPHQLRLWVENIAILQRDLNCSYRAEPMEGFFLEIVKGQLKITEKNPNDYVWHSFWFLIRKTDRVVVGSADFKDIPNDKQEVEIGYGLGKEFEHQGYMTEAVKAICEWALRQENVAHIIAETEKDGFASQRILQHCGFIEEQHGDTIWWKL